MDTSEISLETQAPLSRKGKRQHKKNETPTPNPIPINNAIRQEPSPDRSLKPQKESIPKNLYLPPPPMAVRKILVASLGNPPPYTSTLHSAGHILLTALGLSLSYPPFTKSRSLANGLVSYSPDDNNNNNPSLPFTLWQCPSLMNVSGKSLSTAYHSFLKSLCSSSPPHRSDARLVVIHDELEVALGKIKVKRGGSSRGHNGVRSCVEALGGMEFLRIGVGIGRPVGRGKDEVASYVLKKMSQREREGVEGCVDEVVKVLREEAGGS
ncbi:MAG: aminoacyl-tRNA hydrolase [Candelina mexicana]|nr:MAG: aminoacyl-tRNA hydrolase [Candelina mexicana]